MRKKTTNYATPSRAATKVGRDLWYADNDKLKGGWIYQDKNTTLSKSSRGPMGPMGTQTTSPRESVSMSKKQTLAAYEKLRRKMAKKQKPDGLGFK